VERFFCERLPVLPGFEETRRGDRRGIHTGSWPTCEVLPRIGSRGWLVIARANPASASTTSGGSASSGATAPLTKSRSATTP